MKAENVLNSNLRRKGTIAKEATKMTNGFRYNFT